MTLDLFVLFAAAFLAATLLPAQSEIILAVLHSNGTHAAWLLWLVATAGNVLGAMVNWWLGRTLMRYKDRRWFPVSVASLDKATRYYQRFGTWTLLFAWVPFIGDPLTFIAGMFRVHFLWFTLLVTLGKAARYAVILSVF